MKLAFSKKFAKDYRRFPSPIQKAADRQLERLLSDFHHPSLNTKKMQDPRDIWEARVTKGYRFTFRSMKTFISSEGSAPMTCFKSLNKNTNRKTGEVF